MNNSNIPDPVIPPPNMDMQERETLQRIEMAALAAAMRAEGELSRAYQHLAYCANVVDAMLARSSVPVSHFFQDMELVMREKNHPYPKVQTSTVEPGTPMRRFADVARAVCQGDGGRSAAHAMRHGAAAMPTQQQASPDMASGFGDKPR